MLRPNISVVHRCMSAMASKTPMADALRRKITEALKPTRLDIHNDSHLHSHHHAMVGSTSQETHFRVVIISEAFKSKLLAARHRMVYALMSEELSRKGGIHALQLTTRTPQEEQDLEQREKLKQEASKDESPTGSSRGKGV